MNKFREDMKKKYPDVELCMSDTCGFDNRDHEVCYKYDQHNEDMKKKGMVRVMYEVVSKDFDDPRGKFYEWWNGKKWIKL